MLVAFTGRTLTATLPSEETATRIITVPIREVNMTLSLPSLSYRYCNSFASPRILHCSAC